MGPEVRVRVRVRQGAGGGEGRGGDVPEEDVNAHPRKKTCRTRTPSARRSSYACPSLGRYSRLPHRLCPLPVCALPPVLVVHRPVLPSPSSSVACPSTVPDARASRVGVPGGRGGDNGGGGAGGAAVPHLQCVADARRGRGAGAAVQFMMRALGCMSDGKGVWGWLCVCARGADVCVCAQGM